ncbi:hypothetical protein FGO68_gene13991 [Halteria grandinella]|uniref:Uncharacterized protein n=1 Tax=Halteria grandinella TaxID=5974 RepID=A0A8J8SVU1_HALGN|nr:hypothetical protein FGO68_gene13991 [Halteria grandinella]
MKSIKIVIDPFCFKQFEAAAGSLFINFDKQAFADRINDFYLAVKDNGGLKDGYAPFCKHLFIENFTDAISAFVEITPENERFLKSAYEARRENELPVLNRFLDRAALESQLGVAIGKAKYLDIILYSKAQVQEENKATGFTDPNVDIDYDYGIVSVKPQDADFETPMQPITMMRNSLGKEQGGSGVELVREKYMDSVAFWSKYATLK